MVGRCSPAGSAETTRRCCSTGTAGRRASTTCRSRPAAPRQPERSSVPSHTSAGVPETGRVFTDWPRSRSSSTPGLTRTTGGGRVQLWTWPYRPVGFTSRTPVAGPLTASRCLPRGTAATGSPATSPQTGSSRSPDTRSTEASTAPGTTSLPTSTAESSRSGTATNSSPPSYAPQTRRSARSTATAARAEVQSETA